MPAPTDHFLIDMKPETAGVGPSRRAAAWTGGIGLVIAVVLGATIFALGDGPLAVDSWWHDLMVSSRSDLGLVIAGTLQTVGDVIPMIILGGVLVGALLVLRRPWSALTVATAMLSAEIIAAILKTGIARLRPLDSLSDLGPTSYPSGHATIAATVVVVLALLLRRRWLWILAACWAVAMAWSRTYLEAHWVTDVVGGAILGASVALLAWAAINTLASAVHARRLAAHTLSGGPAQADQDASVDTE